LKAAELREKDMAKTEELQMQHLTLEEIAERRAELRKARDLMFRAEIKAKRVAKIKSKAYRKIQKKERAKNAERLKEMDIGADEEAERMEAEIDRARERATLKHKNTGKWAMSMKHRGELDEDQRKEMQEMYDRGERLKRKIAGLGSDQDADDNDSQESDDDADVMAAALRELDELARDEPGAKAKSGLMEMQFMKRAERKENARSQGLVDSFKEELNRLGVTDEEGPATSHDQADSLVRVGGRVYYQSGGNVRPLLKQY
jgi:U3 small nucleolar RNA-associated protein 14